MTNIQPVNPAAPLKNVAAFATMLETVIERRPDLPGMSCFSGPSGYGKSRSAIYGATIHRAAYVECTQFTTAKSLLTSVLREYGVDRPRGSVTDLIDNAAELMAANPRVPLLVDEAHHVAHKRFVDVLRSLHDFSQAPVVLIGEETLPTELEAHERVHNRMLTWTQAVPLDREDFGLLAGVACRGVTIEEDLAQAILDKTAGNTRRVVVNLARVEEVARQLGTDTIGLAGFSAAGELIMGKAPSVRRVG